MESKYQFNNPKTTKEYIEAIYEEINFTEKGRKNFNYQITMKDLLISILEILQKSNYSDEIKEEDERISKSYSKYVLLFIGVCCLSNGGRKTNIQWINDHHVAVQMWGVALMSIFVGISLENINFFDKIWSFGWTKIISSVAVSSLFIFCTGKASSLINKIFYVDASLLPYTRTFVSGFLFFEYSCPLIIFVLITICLFYALSIFSWLIYESDKDFYNFPYQSFWFIFSSLILIIFCSNYLNNNFKSYEIERKIYELGHALDFNESYSCSNIPQGFSVIFLGSRQDRVLVDYRAPSNTDFSHIIEKENGFGGLGHYEIKSCNDS